MTGRATHIAWARGRWFAALKNQEAANVEVNDARIALRALFPPDATPYEMLGVVGLPDENEVTA